MENLFILVDYRPLAKNILIIATPLLYKVLSRHFQLHKQNLLLWDGRNNGKIQHYLQQLYC